MNAVLIGSVSSSVAALRGLSCGGLEIAGVLGLHGRHAGRVSDYHDLEPFAREARIPFYAFEKVTDAGVYAFLRERPFDWLFAIGLSQLIPEDIRAMPTAGAVGFHPTPLPEGRGRAPVAWTILLQRPAAANLFFLTDEADAGDIIAQRTVPVLPGDYAADLIARTNDVLEQMCAVLSPAFAAGRVPRIPQDPAKATYYPRRRPEDGLIDWTRTAEEIYRLVRAVSRPYPGAFTHRRGEKLIIWRAEPVDTNTMPGQPGSIMDILSDRPVVQTGGGLLVLTEMESADTTLAVGQTLG
ncbi:MAG: methionyl-tRNA formyltransferase [Phycisphaerales bacterium]|nr:methionyl-tRNA formyltransferase [Phycisphaerales bacterium]